MKEQIEECKLKTFLKIGEDKYKCTPYELRNYTNEVFFVYFIKITKKV